MLTIRATVNGDWKPNDLPDIEVGSVRKLTLNLSGAIGAATVSSLAISSDNLTFGTPAVVSPSVTVTMTAAQTGAHHITTTAVLSNGETIKGALRVKVIDSTCEGTRDYG